MIAAMLPPRQTQLLVELAHTEHADDEARDAAELAMLQAPKNRAQLRTFIATLPKASRRAIGFGWNRNAPLVTK